MTAIAAAAGGAAWASGTTAGQTITNTATVGYTVGGVQQPDVNSNAASFVVDMLVNMSVAEVGGSATVVAPGAASQISSFTVTNTSNSTLDFILSVAQQANGAATAFGGTDAGNASNVHIYVDNGDGLFNPAQDTAIYIDQLAADASVKVFIVADVPFGLANGAAIGFSLTAQAANGSTASSQGAALVATAGADSPGSMDIVFGDAAGVNDSANDGKYSDDDEYRISTATLLVSKMARVMSDPFNGTSNPKPVPGAVIEYCIVMQNTGAASATGLVVTDTVPTHTTYVAGSIKSAGSFSSGACNSDGATEDDDASDSGEPDTATGSFVSGVVTVNLATVTAGQTLTALFHTTID
jgi:uncharacterized repeat protein (TIGR01451 family)